MNKKIKKYLIIFTILIELSLIISLILIVIFGTYPYFSFIQSESMSPIIKTEDILFLNKIENISKLENNSIIAFYNPFSNKIIIHRIIGIEDKYYLTKGDNNLFIDKYLVEPNNIIGIINK